MNTTTLTRAEFNALPTYDYLPGRQVAMRWKRQAGTKWFLVEYVDGGGFMEMVIREIVIEDKAE